MNNYPNNVSERAQRVLEESRIAIFIVAYNAEKHIKKVIERIPTWVSERLTENFVIDDYSSDNTFTVAANLEWPSQTDLASGRSRIFEVADRLLARLARAWPRLFAYQILIERTRTDSAADLMRRTFLFALDQARLSPNTKSELILQPQPEHSISRVNKEELRNSLNRTRRHLDTRLYNTGSGSEAMFRAGKEFHPTVHWLQDSGLAFLSQVTRVSDFVSDPSHE